MKRILFFLLLLVNLQLTTDNGSLGIGLGRVSAQGMLEEMLAGVEVTGSSNVECDQCHTLVPKSTLDNHKSSTCPNRMSTCSRCHKQYQWNDVHNCENEDNGTGNNPSNGSGWGSNSYCPLCNKPISKCKCNGWVVIGNHFEFIGNLSAIEFVTSGSVAFNGGSFVGGGGGNGGGGNPPGKPSTITINGKTYYLYQGNVYKLKTTDKLCSDLKELKSFTDQKPSFTQSTDKTCVPAGMAYVSKLFGDGSITETSAWLKLIKSDAVYTKTINGIGDWTSTNDLKKEIIKELGETNLQVTEDVKDIKSFIDKGGAVLSNVCIGSNCESNVDGTYFSYPEFHNVIVTGYNDDGIIIYDTNKDKGNYSVVPENSLYNYYIGVQKNEKK